MSKNLSPLDFESVNPILQLANDLILKACSILNIPTPETPRIHISNIIFFSKQINEDYWWLKKCFENMEPTEYKEYPFKMKDEKGYVLLYSKWGSQEEWPKPEHRYLIEKKIGRKLKASEIIHHINGKRDDNSLDNLTIVSAKQHGELHHSRV